MNGAGRVDGDRLKTMASCAGNIAHWKKRDIAMMTCAMEQAGTELPKTKRALDKSKRIFGVSGMD